MLAVATNMVILAVGIVYSAGQARGIRPNSPSIFGILPSTNAGSPDVTGLSGYIEVCEHFCIDGPTKGSGEMMDKQLKSMIKELGEAINGSLSDSEQIAEVISRIKEGGYDVFVVRRPRSASTSATRATKRKACLDLGVPLPISQSRHKTCSF